MSLNFSATKDGPEVLCNFTIFNDIPKGWVIQFFNAIFYQKSFEKKNFVDKSKGGDCQ
jgi:hypothetical protein